MTDQTRAGAFRGVCDELRHPVAGFGVYRDMRSLSVTLVLLAVAAASCSRDGDGRSAGPAHLAGIATPPAFSRADATGLFVGIRTFRNDDMLTVPYAADDAVDLAYRFSLTPRVGLVPPRNVVLALSGEPQKEESRKRLRALKDAGARIVRNVTAEDILRLLKEQAALTGRDGLLVLSLATHGFQQDGNGYILGSTSSFGSPDTALPLATLFDAAAQAPRSLIFVDACRDRISRSSRGAAPDPAAGAPHIRKMARMHGQVIFYAAAPGEYASDDLVRQNGVFTRAVLDGLNCEASSPGNTVIAETLHRYVDREVRRWIQENRNRTVNPATQVSMEGETPKMPLAQCIQSLEPAIRVSVDGSTITAYDADTRPLWRKNFGRPIVHADVTDLDGDAFDEVVVGLADGIEVFNRDGRRRWEKRGETAALHTFTTGDLFEKKTKQVVALWRDGHSSRLTVFDSEGAELSVFDYKGELQHVAVDRPTRMHAPKIAVTTANSLFLLHPRKLTPLWHHALRSAADTITGLRILDADHDSRRDLVITTTTGTTWFTFDGRIVRRRDEAGWKKVARRNDRLPPS